MNITKTFFLFLCILLSITFYTSKVFAHTFHYEVQVSNTLVTNEKNHLEALKLTFLYDGEVSHAMLQDNKNLGTLGKKLVNDLGRLGYFTQVKLNGKVLNASKAKDIKLEKISAAGNGGNYDALQLNFTLPLKNPTPISNNSKISLAHEDPTAVAILYYENAQHIVLSDNLKNNCTPSVKEKSDFEEGEFPQIVKIDCNS